MNDGVDKLVIFLGKRAGIDKLVKTIQYASKLTHWHLRNTRSDLADRAKKWELSSGLARKAYRTGQFVAAFNDLRRRNGPPPSALSVAANAGQMAYYFFDHVLWLARIGVLDGKRAASASFVSAFGEAIWYVCNLIADAKAIAAGIRAEREIGASEKKGEIEKIRAGRTMRLMGMAADSADFVIAAAEIHPNPFCNHVITLGISGLISAWAGWYRNWP
ncbi:peroxisomal biogenesis factor 11 family protein, partial [Genlisea aurea]